MWNTNQQGIEMGVPESSANSDYQSGEKSSNSKCYLAIAALILSAIAILLAIGLTVTVIPSINSSSLGAEANNDDGDDMTSTYNPTNEPTERPTPYPTNMPITWSPTAVGETRSPTNSPTTRAPTARPTSDDGSYTNTTDRYYETNTTEWYDVDCACSSETVGVINVNQTYWIGGYVGWDYTGSYPELYPFPDVTAQIGDYLQFKAGRDSWSGEDVWIVPETTYYDCDFTSGFGGVQIAVSNEVRADGPDYNGTQQEGHMFRIRQHHIEEWGNPLYFASSYNWDDGYGPYYGCARGVKVRVFVQNRTAIPVVTDVTSSSFDLLSTDVVAELIASIGYLSRTLILAQFSDEQRIRSEGDSGLTNVRGYYDGGAAYDDGRYSNYAAASIHDHADNMHLVGIGEIQAVLNGVEFQTRHNDYNLNMASTTSTEYGLTESIPRPDVPPEVLAYGPSDIDGQIGEMIEWFRAFKTQNTSHRNYVDYFKPILCYLEGTWLLDSDLDEPFDSDRHSFDATSWKQLHDKIRYMTNSGRKNTLENLAHLPSSIRNLWNDTYPILSNWEYRILCHPLTNNIPTSRFRISNDLAIQLLGSPETRTELYYSRRARFEINKWYNDTSFPSSLDDYSTGNINPTWNEGQIRWNYLDYLMEQIPGKDNYVANLVDDLPDSTYRTVHYMDDSEINSGYYSRFYSLTEDDAMGTTQHRRGWSDRYLFAAKTSHSEVSPIKMVYEVEEDDGSISYYPTDDSRWSYAVPLEIIYMTPLTSWNPYNISYIDRDLFDYSVTGECGVSPLTEWTDDMFYYTPSSFFSGITSTSSADTADSNICVVSPIDGLEYPVIASGHWITFPEISGVGRIRQRYPIFPIHVGGNQAFKEIKATQATILPSDYDNVETGITFWTDERDIYYGFNLYLEGNGGGHSHLLNVPGWRVYYYWYDYTTEEYYNGTAYSITEDTEIANSHQHTVELYRYRITVNDVWVYKLIKCRYGDSSDSEITYPFQNDMCADFHDTLTRDTGEE